MGDALAIFIVTLLLVQITVWVQRWFEVRDRWIVQLSAVTFWASSFILILLTKYVLGGGDMMTYHERGSLLASLVRQRPSENFPELIKMIMQQETTLPVFYQRQSPASTMEAIGGLGHLLLFDSTWGVGLLFAVTSFLGCAIIYRGFRDALPDVNKRHIALVAMMTPSVVYWSAGLVKEGIALPGLALLLWGVIQIAQRRTTVGVLVALVVGAQIVALTKTYILVPWVAGTSIYIFLARSRQAQSVAVKPLYCAVGAVLAVVGFVMIGRMFPRFAIGDVLDEAQRMQTAHMAHGGSNYSIGGQGASVSAQLANVPIALISSFARPFPHEAHNMVALVTSIEITAITAFMIRQVVVAGPAKVFARITTSPPLMFALTYSVLLALGVGLTTTNLGTLARYRMPLLPTYLILLVSLTPELVPRRVLNRDRALASPPSAAPVSPASPTRPPRPRRPWHD